MQDRHQQSRSTVLRHQGLVDEEDRGAEQLALCQLPEARLVKKYGYRWRHLGLELGLDPLGTNGVPSRNVVPNIVSKDMHVRVSAMEGLSLPLVRLPGVRGAQERRCNLHIVKAIQCREEMLVVQVGDDIVHHPIEVGGVERERRHLAMPIRLDRVAVPVHCPGDVLCHSPVPPRSKNSQARS